MLINVLNFLNIDFCSIYKNFVTFYILFKLFFITAYAIKYLIIHLFSYCL